jgi:hypothetical protein
MGIRIEGGRGSGSWVRQRLLAASDYDTWRATPEARELIDWLRIIAARRTGRLRIDVIDRPDVVQDALEWALSSLRRSFREMAGKDNPAAALEFVVSRGVAQGRHHVRMAGIAGARANGRGWQAPFPSLLHGEMAALVMGDVLEDECVESQFMEQFVHRFVEWVVADLGILITDDAAHAVMYVLDRVVAGAGRSALLRGGHSSLTSDPAMRYLGFTPTAARRFAVWLLGQSTRTRIWPSLLDAVVEGRSPDAMSLAHWRREAIKYGFGTALPAAA